MGSVPILQVPTGLVGRLGVVAGAIEAFVVGRSRPRPAISSTVMYFSSGEVPYSSRPFAWRPKAVAVDLRRQEVQADGGRFRRGRPTSHVDRARAFRAALDVHRDAAALRCELMPILLVSKNWHGPRWNGVRCPPGPGGCVRSEIGTDVVARALAPQSYFSASRASLSRGLVVERDGVR